MHQQSDIKVTKIQRLVSRPGFPGRFHRVTFEWDDDGLVHSSFQVWVPLAHPEADVERVARDFLWRRLLDLAELAQTAALSEPEIGASRKRRSGNRRIERQRHKRAAFLQQTPSHVERAHILLARYVLSGNHEPVPCDDLVTWKAWMGTPERWVQDTLLTDSADNQVRICTVFLGLDVSFGLEEPVLFETMVLGGMCDRELYRYCTWDEAQEGHGAILERVKNYDKQMADNPAVLKARDLANRTVETSGRTLVKTLIETAQITLPGEADAG